MRLGVDLGGTKIEIVALDDDGRERWRARVPTPQGDYEATLDAIAALVREAEERVRMTRDLTRSLHRELWHREDEVAIEAPGDEEDL